MSSFRDRIKELRRVKCSELHANPKNWRVHPQPQREAVRGILAEIGFADALLARETPEGLILIDGHLRAEESGEQEVPVLILDVTEEEGDKLLALIDPLAAMAEADEEKQRELLAQLEAEEADLKKLLGEMKYRLGDPESDDEDEDQPAIGGPEEMKLRPHEHYDYVLVFARNTREWNRLMDLLKLPFVERKGGRLGTARGIFASQLIEIIERKGADGNA